MQRRYRHAPPEGPPNPGLWGRIWGRLREPSTWAGVAGAAGVLLGRNGLGKGLRGVLTWVGTGASAAAAVLRGKPVRQLPPDDDEPRDPDKDEDS